jgi:hypothetical protein
MLREKTELEKSERWRDQAKRKRWDQWQWVKNTGWVAPFAQRVLDNWARHSKQVGAKEVADRVINNIKNLTNRR